MTATLPKGRGRPKCVSQTCALAECFPDQQHCESEHDTSLKGEDMGSSQNHTMLHVAITGTR